MKRAPLLLCAGTVAGFVGVLSLHGHQAPVAGVSPSDSPSGGSGGSAGGGAAVAGPSVAGPGAVRSAVGPDVQYGYGVLDVKVTVRGTHITDVSVPLLQTAEPTSQQISTEAIAILRGEALSAQSGHIDAISGATYTSEAYIQSLQAALDKLPAK